MTTENMHATLARIMGEVGRVEKKGKITSQGSGPTYKFARDTDVLEAVTPKMAEAGIVLAPERMELLSMEPSLSGRQIIANIKASWLVTDGKSELRFETLGQGADSGDKALPKAQSNARKYAFFMLYHIVTGDDPDHYASYEQPQDGERRSSGEGRTSAKTRPAASPDNTLGYLKERIAEAARAHGIGFAQLELMAKAEGVKSGTHATVDQLRAILARIEQPSSGVPTAPAGEAEPVVTPPPTEPAAATGSPPSSEPSPDALMDDIIAVTGGEEIPRPGTDAYKALPAAKKAEARAHWDRQQQPEQTELPV